VPQVRFLNLGLGFLSLPPAFFVLLLLQYPFVRVKCNPGIHPPLFQTPNKNLATGFKKFLDTLRTLDHKLHQDFIIKCHHYARAVKEVGVDAEMVFIRLVSAIETLSTNRPLDHKDDKLEKQGVTDLIEQSTLPKELKNELKTVFDVRKSGKRFVRFIEKHSNGFFKGGNFKAKQLKIKRATSARC
jgi:hypothetical protein